MSIALAGTAVTEDDVFARKIFIGWVFPTDLRHFNAKLNRVTLHNDMDPGAGGCECSFWMNIDRSPREWFRLRGYDRTTRSGCGDDNKMDITVDREGSGTGYWKGQKSDSTVNRGCTGELDFWGPEFDFFVQDGRPFTVSATAYDSDCVDDFLRKHVIARTVVVLSSDGLQYYDVDDRIGEALALCAKGDPYNDNDGYKDLKRRYGPKDGRKCPDPDPDCTGYHVGEPQDVPNGKPTDDPQYTMHFTISDVPIAPEPVALGLAKECTPPLFPPEGGQISTCTIVIENPSTGCLFPGDYLPAGALPKNVVATDTVRTSVKPDQYKVDATFSFSGPDVCNVRFGESAAAPCDPILPEPPGGKQLLCDLGTVPVGGLAIITVRITSRVEGDFTDEANLFTSSVAVGGITQLLVGAPGSSARSGEGSRLSPAVYAAIAGGAAAAAAAAIAAGCWYARRRWLQ